MVLARQIPKRYHRLTTQLPRKKSAKPLGEMLFLSLISTFFFAAVTSAIEQSHYESLIRDASVPDHPSLIEQPNGLHEQRGALEYSIWPFDGNSDKADNSCSTHKSCDECSKASSWCHWCSHDNACHEKGSYYGCLEGASCANKTEPHKEDKGCGAHTNCGECALSSIGCHWCGSDNACHAVGSIYGCLTGVNCYSDDRCRRKEPVAVSAMTFQEMGFGPMLAILFLSTICFCCSTLGFCVAGGVKGAYDDLVEAAMHNAPQDNQTQPQLPSTTPVETQQDGVVEEILESNGENTALLRDEDVESADDYNLLHDVDPRQPPLHRSQLRCARGRGTKHMDCLFNACRACYIVNVLTILAVAVCSVRYYPKIPKYNICNDSVAWKSLVDSMTSLSIEGNFEILASVMNPNHFDVAVDMGRGTFKHNGVYVGTFEIPPTVISAMAITDIAIVATFTPEKWEALSLSAEYYRGTLAFTIDAQSMIRIPVLFDYSMEADFGNMYVKVNDPNLKDRHLCACPNWDELKNKTRPHFLNGQEGLAPGDEIEKLFYEHL